LDLSVAARDAMIAEVARLTGQPARISATGSVEIGASAAPPRGALAKPPKRRTGADRFNIWL
jgi:hypothetical protein